MIKFGKVKALRENAENGFIEAQVEVELEKLNWYKIATIKGIQWEPKVNDQVTMLIDESDNGVVISEYLKIEEQKRKMTDVENLKIKNIRQGKTIVQFTDENNIEKAKVTDQGEVWMKQADIQNSSVGTYTINEAGSTVHSLKTRPIKWMGTTIQVLCLS